MFENTIKRYRKECDLTRSNSLLFLIELLVGAINFGLYYIHKNSIIILIIYFSEYIIHIILIKKIYKIKDNDNNVSLLKKIIKQNNIDTPEEINIFRDYISTKKDNKIKMPWGVWVSVFFSLILSILSNSLNEDINYNDFLNINYGGAMKFVYIFALSLLILSFCKYIYLIIKEEYNFYNNLTMVINHIYFKRQQELIKKKSSIRKKNKETKLQMLTVE